MIISASRRTDIPAFYSDWFFKRLEAGYCDVRNPMSPSQVSRIQLNPDVVDCIVFWTKNPEPMRDKLHLLKDYNYYFQFTITPYSHKLEKCVPDIANMTCLAHELADKIGNNKVVWRYDPILLSADYSVKEHIKQFRLLAKAMSGASKKCVISFYDEYKPVVGISQPNLEEIDDLAAEFQIIAGEHGFVLETCSEVIDLTKYGIQNGKCIDDRLISEIVGQPLVLNKDKGQRKECGCVMSIDIGAYSSCRHGCVYCYAQKAVQLQKHKLDSTMLLGELQPNDKVVEKNMVSFRKGYVEETF